MDLLLAPDVFVEYFKNVHKVNNTSIQSKLHLLLYNSNNRYLLSHPLLTIIEKSFSKAQFDALVGPYITHLIDNRALIVKNLPKEAAVSVIDAMVKCYHDFIDNKKDLFVNICVSENNASKICNSVVINRIAKPEVNWLLFEIACINPQSVTLRYFDFSANAQIVELFDNLFLRVAKSNAILIYDRQSNLAHPYFKAIANSLIFYYTTIPRNNVEKAEKINEIKRMFRKVIIFSGRANQIHERRICIGDLIIETDDDFWNLEFDRPTWKIDITYSSYISIKLKEKCKLFQRVT